MAKEQETTGAPPAPTHHLVVIHPFADYRRGDRITDAAEIARVMSCENAHHCHKVAAANEPAAPAAPAPAATSFSAPLVTE